MPERKHPYTPARNQRLAAQFCEVAGQVCFITIRAYNRQSPFLDAGLAGATVETLRTEREQWRCGVHAYCLMPDHLQLLTWPREDGWSVLTFIDRFKGKSTNRSWDHGWNGKLWQPRSYDEVVRHEQALPDMVRYILSDPVRTGLVAEPEQYPWCGVWDPLPI